MTEYELLSKQQEFINVPHDYKLDVAMYQGGYGSGKTWCGSLLGIMLARKYPGCVGLVGAKEYELVRKTTLESYFDHLKALNYKLNVDYSYNKQDKIISFKNGSKIHFSQLDDHEKMKSLNLHWAEIEEASQIKDSSFEQLIGRVRKEIKPEWKNFRYRIFGHTNPQPNKDWIYRRFVEEKRENYRLIIAPTTNNKYLPEHYVQEMQAAYDPEYYRINVLGEFGDYSSGLIVKGFSDKNIANIKYNENLTLYLTCDFNVDPMCWEVAHMDSEMIYFFDEIVIENTTTQQCIEEFIRRYPNHKGKIVICGDASGDNRSTQSEYTNYVIMRNALRKYGKETGKQNYVDSQVKIRDYNPKILDRVQAFNAMIKNAQGNVRMLFSPVCKWLLYNINNLSYKDGTTIIDVPTITTIQKDRNSKFLMHPFDAASYLVEYHHPIRQISKK